MVEVDLNHIYKKYAGNDRYSVNDFDLHIKERNSSFSLVHLAVVSQLH